jgi:hypothetical protein
LAGIDKRAVVSHSYDRVLGVLGRYVRGEVDWDQFEHLRPIGLDEISLLKGDGDNLSEDAFIKLIAGIRAVIRNIAGAHDMSWPVISNRSESSLL